MSDKKDTKIEKKSDETVVEKTKSIKSSYSKKKKTKKSVEALMGKKPELRFKFITENSKRVSAENIL